jgi:NTE family protein
MSSTAPARRPRRSAAQAAPAAPSPSSPRGLDLALQGGGSHGAFTWGVLDALLEDGRLRLDGVSGTSAGAMNAAVLATGYAHGGAAGAREALSRFWAAVSGQPDCWAGTGHKPALGQAGSASAWMFNRDLWPGYTLWESWLRQFSPYQLNPFNFDPLRDIVAAHVDVDALRRGPLKVYVTATSVHTGQPKVFEGEALSVQALLASACLPQSAQTVVIDGEPYWDGGFSGNPSLWPLVYGTASHDILLVQINPRVHVGVPTTAIEINDRINEITFNASLVAEMRAIAFVQKLVRQRRVDPEHYKDMRLHRVADEAGLAPFDASSKLNADPRLLQTLFDLGRAAGERWLTAHADDVGVRGTLDVDEVFLADRSNKG